MWFGRSSFGERLEAAEYQCFLRLLYANVITALESYLSTDSNLPSTRTPLFSENSLKRLLSFKNRKSLVHVDDKAFLDHRLSVDFLPSRSQGYGTGNYRGDLCSPVPASRPYLGRVERQFESYV